jgi:tetratricopeptide (TPR) repeat protein
VPSASNIDELMSQGLRLHQAGRTAEAEAIYRKVIGRQPSHGAANHLLGLVLLGQGEAEAAVAHLKRAVHVRGNDPQYNANLGVALNAAGRPGEAVVCLDRAIALKPDFAEAHSNRGMALKNAGRLIDAAASYRAALSLMPEEAGFHLNLANVLTELGELRHAESGYRRALELRPGYPAAVKGLCLTLETYGRPGDAVALAEAYIAANPEEPEYHRASAHAYWTWRRPDEAAAGYRRLIALRPADAEAHRMLGLIVHRTSVDDEVRAIESLIGRHDLGIDLRSQLEFALGKAFDDIGNAEASFAHYARGNALQRQLAPFVLASAEAGFESMFRLFADLPAPLPQPRAATGPVFIVGLPRSGKSSIEGMLARHPDLFAAGELPVFTGALAKFRLNWGFDRPGFSLADIAPEAFVELGSAYMAEVSAFVPPGKRVIDTMPINFWNVGFIRLALPNARIVHAVRDPFEHAVALFQKYFAGRGYEYAADFGDIAAYGTLYRRLMSFWHQRFPGFARDVDVAVLRRDPETETRGLLDFLGLGWHPAVVESFETEPQVGGGSVSGPRDRASRLEPYLQESGRFGTAV